VRLFVERSQAVRRDFALTNENAPAVAQICVRLDGLPLAIELAAVRNKIFTPQALLGRLDNRLTFLTGGTREAAARQRTLRAAIDWSYDLLDAAEQRLFARVAVFVGGCTLAAAETVCNAAGSLELDILDGLASLVDKSLLRQAEDRSGEPRFTMLETLREYAQERLAENGEAHALRMAHAAYYLTLAEAAAEGMVSSSRIEWLAQLDAEHDNLRAALAWCQAAHDDERLLRLSTALWRYWAIRRHVDEGCEYLEGALAREASGRDTPARANALFGAGILACIQGDNHTASRRLEESVALWRRLGDRRGLAYALADGGYILAKHDHATLLALAEESIALFREVGDTWGLALATHNLGAVAALGGDYAAMRAHAAEGLALFRSINDRLGVLWGLEMLAYASSQHGDNATARATFEECVALGRELGDVEGLTDALIGLGWVIWIQGDAERLADLFTETLALAQESGNRWHQGWARSRLGWAAWMHGDLPRAQTLFEASQTHFSEMHQENGLAWALSGQGHVAWGQDDIVLAGNLLTQSLDLFRIDGFKVDIAFALNSLGRVAWAGGDAAGAAELFAESLALSWEQGDRWGLAAALEGSASLIGARGLAQQAAQIYGASAALREVIAAPLWQAYQADYERNLSAIRSQLGQKVFAAAWDEGRAMPLEQLVAFALANLH